MKRLRASVLAFVVTVVVLGGADRAGAACHIAAFTNTDLAVREDAGEVKITVELVGGTPSCAGTVRYGTSDGTATAPGDYRRREGVLRFEAGDDRRESFSITIIDDTADEKDESFTVELSGGTGSIQADQTPATVTITDDDTPSPPDEDETEEPSADDGSPADQTSPDSEEGSPRTTGRATTTPGASTPSATGSPSQAGGGGGSNAGLIAGIVAAIVAAAGAAGIWWKRRGARGA